MEMRILKKNVLAPLFTATLTGPGSVIFSDPVTPCNFFVSIFTIAAIYVHTYLYVPSTSYNLFKHAAICRAKNEVQIYTQYNITL